MPAYRVKLRRGTSAEHANFVGAEGEVTVDTDKKRLVVHDGVTPGGFLIAALEDVKTDISEYTDSEGLMGGYTYDVQGTTLPLTSTSPIVNYTVTVASGFRYNGRGIPGGPGDVFYLRNDTAGETEFTENPHITLQTGYTYIFDMSDASNIGHPLQFTTDMGQTAFTSGVTTLGTAGQAGATVTFTVPSPRPLNLMYYCGVHGAGMGGEITVGSDAYVAPVAPVSTEGLIDNAWVIRSDDLSITYETNYYYDVTKDADDNIFAVGYTGSPAKSNVTKIEPNGTVVFNKSFGTTSGSNRIYSTAIYSDGSIALAGLTEDVNATQGDIAILAKMSSVDGSFIWQKFYNGGYNEEWHSVSLDSSDNAYVGGKSGSYMGGGSFSSTHNGVVAKYDSSGVMSWHQVIYNSSYNYNDWRGSAIDSNGDVWFVGDYSPSSGWGQTLLVKLNSTNGSIVTGYHISASNTLHNIQCNCVKIDGDGNLLLGGKGRNSSTNSDEAVIIKLNPSDGSIIWIKRYTNSLHPSSSWRVSGIDPLSDGNIVVTVSAWSQATYILKYDTAGELLSDVALTTTAANSYGYNDIFANGADIDSNNQLLICGSTMPSDPAQYNSSFVAKIPHNDPNGELLGTYGDYTFADASATRTDGTLTALSAGHGLSQSTPQAPTSSNGFSGYSSGLGSPYDNTSNTIDKTDINTLGG